MPIFKRKQEPEFEGSGLVLFKEVQGAMKAERVLKNEGYETRLVAPPPQMRKGCDLAVAINLVEKPGIERLLEKKSVAYVEISPMKTGTLDILQIVNITDFGKWLMVKSANMKLTFDKETGEIVNTSGGGCPDIPLLHYELVGKKLTEAPDPRTLGYTLCALMLNRAYEESLALWKEDK
jgi:hypothetical protein